MNSRFSLSATGLVSFWFVGLAILLLLAVVHACWNQPVRFILPKRFGYHTVKLCFRTVWTVSPAFVLEAGALLLTCITVTVAWLAGLLR